MKGLKNMKPTAGREAQAGRAVPLVLPHGGADASCDFESAFEMLQGDDRARDLWHREPLKIPLPRAR